MAQTVKNKIDGDVTQFLKKIAKHATVELSESTRVKTLIKNTIEKQKKTLKLKDVDQERLKMVIQL